MNATEARQSEEALMSSVWLIFRASFGQREWVQSVTPWGGDRAIVVTNEGVYEIAPDGQTGFTAIAILRR